MTRASFALFSLAFLGLALSAEAGPMSISPGGSAFRGGGYYSGPAYSFPQSVFNPLPAPYAPYYGQYPYQGYTGTYISGYSGNPLPATYQLNTQLPVMVAVPGGEQRQPPANAAVVQVRVPDPYAGVLFDGAKSSTLGDTRWYVTPALEKGKGYTYEITATWTRNGQPVTEKRKVEVAAGKTTIVDFTRR